MLSSGSVVPFCTRMCLCCEGQGRPRAAKLFGINVVRCLGILLLSGIFLCTTLLWTSQAHAAKKPRKIVKDLFYGEVLFYFYQEDYFPAIVRLLAAKDKDRMPHHRDEAELLLGGMSLSYGMHLEALRIFQALLREGAPAEVRDRAWFYLGRALYQKGFIQEAYTALNSIESVMTDEDGLERRVMLGILLIQQGKFAEAEKMLDFNYPKSPWYPYAQYNRGIALINMNDVKQGVMVLDRVGQLPPRNAEIIALRDKTNLAMGFFHADIKEPLLATKFFERIRLNGPLSSRALLGMGRAHAATDNYQKALVPWMELQARHIHDDAVLESYLSVPYALRLLSDFQQSLQRYEMGIARFNDEIKQIDAAIIAIQNGRLVQTFGQYDDKEGLAAKIKLKEIPQSIENHYLIQLLASHEFQGALKNYRDLVFLQRNVDTWEGDAEVFDTILASRRVALNQRLPQIGERFKQLRFSDYKSNYQEFFSQAAPLKMGEPTTDLASNHQLKLLQKVKNVKERLSQLRGKEDISQQERKFHIIQGRVLMDIYQDHDSRLLQTKNSLNEINGGITEAESRVGRLSQVLRHLPVKLEQYASRIEQKRKDIASLKQRFVLVLDEQKAYMANGAIVELENQKIRLKTYLNQAHLALAQLYDRASESSTETTRRETKKNVLKEEELKAVKPPEIKHFDVPQNEPQLPEDKP